MFVYVLMCDCRRLLDTPGSCFEIESVWSRSINVNVTLNSEPLLPRYNRKQMKTVCPSGSCSKLPSAVASAGPADR